MRFWTRQYRNKFFSTVGDTPEMREVYALFKEHTVAPNWSPEWSQMRYEFFESGSLEAPSSLKLHQVFGVNFRSDKTELSDCDD